MSMAGSATPRGLLLWSDMGAVLLQDSRSAPRALRSAASPGQPSYPGLPRQTDSTGILADRAGQTLRNLTISATPPAAMIDPQFWSLRTPCRRPAAAGKAEK